MQPDFSIENNYSNLVSAGFDEAGRGPLAGPVVAACVIFNRKNFDEDFFKKINDSKKLSKTKRQEIFTELKNKSFFGIGIVDEKTIDEINILQATKLAMLNAYFDLQKKYKIFPEIILVDGNFFPFEKRDKIIEILPIVKGDQKSFSIAAASIIAKETRDNLMSEIHNQYPEFAFDKHKGYPTKLHISKIKEFGICPIHRKSFEPIKSMINEDN